MTPTSTSGAFHLPLLPLGDAILPLAAFFNDHYRLSHQARAQVPPRSLIIRQAPFTAFGVMPAFCPYHRLFIAKVATFAPGNGDGPAVSAIVCVFDGLNGQPLALLEGTQLTNAKCAAISAMVTDICAVDNARVMAVIGSGIQAWQQVRAVMAVRAIAELRVFSPNGDHVADFARRVSQRWPGALQVITPPSAVQAVGGADIFCTATSCAMPLFPAEAVAPHAHINCMGAHTPHAREIPDALLARARVVVEDRQTAVVEAGTIHADALELAQLLSLKSADIKAQLSVFSSTGHGYLDLLTAAFVLRHRHASGGPDPGNGEVAA
ncbi:ornithine cyclodeaminase family protein [Candidatus Sodalis endolongispinus]|uniref:Ornithine cyclodeaminase family protein n=1 Tax=Candidatus Sodalis endolongispinus TaxID=2812662 RepID=A0ABS5YAS3_9GAMM|nr:ornithine cyclodeaminase family protein [Candidatus Sodalis endolongispinus]MBT9432067.1 ornithine cyclodeaminase family protein [Candidatus Sodalis endolongispinus]